MVTRAFTSVTNYILENPEGHEFKKNKKVQ